MLQSIILVKERITNIVGLKKSYNITILIDDYRSKNYLKSDKDRDLIHQHILDLFHQVTSKHNLHIDFFAFESMMIKIAKKIIKRIPKVDKVKEFHRKKGIYSTQLRNQ